MKKDIALILKYAVDISLLLIIFFYPGKLLSQKARIADEEKKIKTYQYSDPNPIPILISNPKIYPYFTFEGYNKDGMENSWKVISLENDYIQVFVLPEAGGKVWGAIEKSTGNEFIYRNEVMKFRNIAMRGPWTSGGIEFNFGIIGHSPSTASKVDYLVRKNEDGSVSCFVGNLDLPSRTYWRVEIRLPEDKAYFETRTSWYNPTPLNQSYYNWMTAAAVAREDLEFFCPGYLYLEHSGEAKDWPVDNEGRKISLYSENDFGPSKSYHVVGTYQDFFGGYYHDKNVGFGHWSPYEEMPGQKLWLWALSRSGGIWEDLLTDTDSQYIEFQAGRLFNQYSPGRHQNPIRQVGFPPYTTDQWKEVWFPFKNIQGMVDASPIGVLNVDRKESDISIGINALEYLNDSLVIYQGGKRIFKENLTLKPMEIYSVHLESTSEEKLDVIVGDHNLYYTSHEDSMEIKRPFQIDPDRTLSDIESLYNEGLDGIFFREYALAEEKLNQLFQMDPTHIEALLLLSELHYRKGEYEKALEKTNLVLQQNTYLSRANYLAGISYRALEDPVNALESMGWAARSMEFRSAAYCQMAEINIRLGKYNLAKEYAKKALDFNSYNIIAWQALAIAERKSNRLLSAKNVILKILEIDPLNHFARFEKSVLEDLSYEIPEFLSGITNEFPEETCLEIAIYYYGLNLIDEAIQILSLGPDVVKNNLWLAYFYRTRLPEKSRELLLKAIASSPEFVFPYRLECLELLNWAQDQVDSWKLKYYMALNYAAIGRNQEAKDLLLACGNQPDNWVFYMTRADLSQDIHEDQQLQDLTKAFELAPESWRSWNRLISFYEDKKKFELALDLSKKAYRTFPDNYTLGFQYAKALFDVGRYENCIDILNNIHILPFEGSFESRMVYENAHLHLAFDLIKDKKYQKAIKILNNAIEWPENIGVGKPYNPDQRRQEFLLAYCYDQLNNATQFDKYINNVIDYTTNRLDRPSPNHLLGFSALKLTGNLSEADLLYNRIVSNQNLNDEFRNWFENQYNSNENESLNSNDMDEDYNDQTFIVQMINLFEGK